MVVVKAYDDFSKTFISIDIPEDILNSTCLKEMVEISEDPNESIVLPAEIISYKTLLRILDERENFQTLVEEFRARDFLALPTENILEKIGTSECFDPSLLGHCQNFVQKYLNNENRTRFLRHFGTQTLSDIYFLYDAGNGSTELFPSDVVGKECRKKIQDFQKFLISSIIEKSVSLGKEKPREKWDNNFFFSETFVTNFEWFLIDIRKIKEDYFVISGDEKFAKELQSFLPEIPVTYSPLSDFPGDVYENFPYVIPEEIKKSLGANRGIIIIDTNSYAPSCYDELLLHRRYCSMSSD